MDENKRRGLAPEVCIKIVHSSPFHLTALLLVFCDAILAASTHYVLVADQTATEYYNQILYFAQVYSSFYVPHKMLCTLTSRIQNNALLSTEYLMLMFADIYCCRFRGVEETGFFLVAAFINKRARLLHSFFFFFLRQTRNDEIFISELYCIFVRRRRRSENRSF